MSMSMSETPMGTAEKLADLSRQHGRALMVARQKDGAHVLYIAPGAEDITGLLMRAALEIDNGLKA
jgi:hypothetical protein